MDASYKKYLPLAELSLRVYIAWYLADYGIAKLTGSMFNNASPEILRTELRHVDLFHLTWYFFSRVTLLSYTVGVLQVVAAVLLIFPKTVLAGCIVALPILLNIFLIDVAVFPSPALAVRVLSYIICLGLFMWYRKAAVKAACKALLQASTGVIINGRLLLLIPLLCAVYLLLEFAIGALVMLIF